jgi:tetratricopeptide (TPR) repeat protein
LLVRRKTLALRAALLFIPALAVHAGQAVRQQPHPELTEFAGPPKPLLPPPNAIWRRFYESKAVSRADKSKPETLRAAIAELNALIKEYPQQPDFYFLRAGLSCAIGATPADMLADLAKTTSLTNQGNAPLLDQKRDILSAKAKAEFRLGKYQDALQDLDAAVKIDYDLADSAFNDGTVTLHTKPDPCVWTLPDFEAMAKQLPADYRPPLYGALYRLSVFKYKNDSDYASVIDALNTAGKLNPSSPLPNYFLGKLHMATMFGSPFSMLGAKCIDVIVPRTADCVKLDEVRRLAVRYLTSSIAVDIRFIPAYAERAAMLLELKDYRQALRDYDRVLELKPDHDLTRIIYNDRALAKMQLGQYSSAVMDFSQSIALGCDTACNSYDNRADAYMKLRDYPRALADVGVSIKHIMSNAIYLMSIDSFRKLYPEYDNVADDVICEKLRALFFPSMPYAVFSKQFLIEAKSDPTFVLSDLYLKRGDIYSKLGRPRDAEAEYDRVTRVFPKFAEGAFGTRNGRRVRVQQ